MNVEKVKKTVKLTILFALIFVAIVITQSISTAGELDATLKKLLSEQQQKHQQDELLNKLRGGPETPQQLFDSRQGILFKNAALKKALGKKEKSSVRRASKSSKKSIAISSEEKPEAIEDAISAKSVVVLDEDSGKLLFSKEPFKKMAPASLTKIMTAIVLIESEPDLNKSVTIKHDIVIRSDGVSLGLKEGDQTTLIDLLYMAMLYSANDACVAIAEEVAGSVSEFAKLMNKKAKEIGAVNSNFVNPNGMPNNNHYSNAYDIAVLSSYAMKLPAFAKVVGTRKYSVKLLTHKEVTVKKARAKGKSVKETKIVEVTRNINLTNRHKLLGKVAGVKGIKTGYTNAAGRCLATAYSAEGKNLIIVVLKAADVANDTLALIDCDKFNSVSNVALSPNIEKPDALANEKALNSKISLSSIKIVK